jgi:hypothetical protein
MVGGSFISKTLVASLLFCPAGPFAASAATVSSQGGEVLISKGQGFVPLKSLTEVAPGGQVMVRPGGIATISYASNCRVRVGSGVWLVQDKAPCADGTTEIDFTTRMGQQAPPPPQGDDFDPLIVGGAVVGGGLLLGRAVSWCQSNNRPASP